MSGESKDLDVMLGDARSAIRSMAVPLILSYLVVQINSFMDTSWCSMLGVDASSAVSTIAPLYWIVGCIGPALGVGASTSIARCLGRGDRDTANSLAVQTVFAGLVLSVVLTPVLYVLIDPLISMMGAGDIRDLCFDYVAPIVICTLPAVMSGVVSGTLRSEGAAKRSTAMLMTSAVANMVLDPVLIFGLDMGLAGAGWATGISSVISLAAGLWWYARGKTYLSISLRGFRFRGDLTRDVLAVGVPRAAENTTNSFMSMLHRIFVIACGGTTGAALFSVPWRYISLSQVVSQGIGSALIPVASAAMGRNDYAKAREASLYAVKITMGPMILIAALLFVFADYAIIPFTLTGSMAEMRSEFAHVLRIYAFIIPFFALADLGSCILQSLRLAQMSMVAAIGRNVLILIFLALTYTISMDAIFYGLLAAEVVGGVAMIWLAKREFDLRERASRAEGTR